MYDNSACFWYLMYDTLHSRAANFTGGCMLTKDRHTNLDLFIADFWVWPIKDDQASMEHPLFSLSKNPDRAIRHYEHNGNSITIAPAAYGLPTIYDKDVLIFCCSQLIEGMKNGRLPSPLVQFEVYDFLVSTNRTTGQQGYTLLKHALDRLHGVNIKTNIKTAGRETTQSFHLLESWRMVEEAANATVQVMLADWLFRAVLSHEVLTLHREYFRLSGGLERRVYELARKHCGNQETWSIHLPLLHKKSGSTATLKRFRQAMKNLTAKPDKLPDYWLAFDPVTDKLTVYPRTRKGGLRQLKDTLGL